MAFVLVKELVWLMLYWIAIMCYRNEERNNTNLTGLLIGYKYGFAGEREKKTNVVMLQTECVLFFVFTIANVIIDKLPVLITL